MKNLLVLVLMAFTLTLFGQTDPVYERGGDDGPRTQVEVFDGEYYDNVRVSPSSNRGPTYNPPLYNTNNNGGEEMCPTQNRAPNYQGTRSGGYGTPYHQMRKYQGMYPDDIIKSKGTQVMRRAFQRIFK